MSTCNRLDLNPLVSQPVIMPRNLPITGWDYHYWFSSEMVIKCTSLEILKCTDMVDYNIIYMEWKKTTLSMVLVSLTIL